MAAVVPAPIRGGLDRSVPVIGACVVGAIAYGGLYCFPPFSLAFASEFGLGRTTAVTPWTIFLVVSAISSPLLGRAYDVFLDRHLLAAGMAVLALGWIVTALAPDIGTLVISYGLLLAVGLQVVFVGVSTAIARRYAGVRGLALGIAYAGPGIGVAILLPLMGPLIPAVGWRTVALGFAGLAVFGLAFVVMMTSGPAIIVPARPRAGSGRSGGAGAPSALPTVGPLRRRLAVIPGDEGELLHETSAPGSIGAAQEPVPTGGGRAPSLRRTLRARRFWVFFAGAVAIGVIDEGLFQAFLPHATGRGLDPDLAAQALGLQSVAYVGGQVAGGALSDRLGRRGTGLGFAVLIAVGAIAAFTATGGEPAVAVGGMALEGFGMGATIAIRSAAFSDVFGGRSYGAVFGVLAVAYPVGGAAAVYLGGLSADRLGTYWPVVWTAVGAAGVWALALWAAGPRRPTRIGRARRAI